jgi:hypothetical protein
MHNHNFTSPDVIIHLIIDLSSNNILELIQIKLSSCHAIVISMMTIENGQSISMCCISDPICRRYKLLLIIKSSCFPFISVPLLS